MSKHTHDMGIYPPCAWDGCGQHGEFKAPKDRHRTGTNLPDDYHFFCLDHIREHNKKWDYFDGMDTEEIEEFRKEAVHGHRPTWKTGLGMNGVSSPHISPEKLEDALADFMHQHRPKPQPDIPEGPVLTAEQRDAFAILDLPIITEWPAIKAKYKRLVKTLHPDVNRDNKQAEERFKKVINAYRCLEGYFNVR